MAGEIQLAEVAEIIMGQSPPSETYNEHGDGLPFFQGVADFNYRHPTPRMFCSAASRIAAPGDILLSVRAPIGRVNVADRKCAIGRGLAVIRPRAPEDARYLEFALRLQEPRWAAIEGGGSVFGNATRRDLESLLLPWPENASERRAIAHILGTLDDEIQAKGGECKGMRRILNHLISKLVSGSWTVEQAKEWLQWARHLIEPLDDKIELNRRMSQTLEAIARALFESWFVRFDPVRRNMARKGRGQPSPLPPLPKGEGKAAPHYRGGYDFAGLVERARELRRAQTPAEEIFWDLVRDRRFLGLKFRRQHQIGDYVVDFYCHEHCLVVEFNGGVHSERREKDHKRDAWLEARGYTVLRFRNEQLLDDPASVLRTIAQRIAPQSLEAMGYFSPSPSGRRAGDEGVVESCAFDHLFPDRLVESELGEIPEGWRVETLADFSALNAEVWTQDTRPARINYVDLSNTKWGRIEAVTSYEATSAPSRAQRVLRPGDTILGTVRPGNGSYALIFEHGLTGSTGFAVLRPKAAHYIEFVYLAATSPENIERLAHLADGAAYPAVRPQVIAATPLVRPPDEVLVWFSQTTGPMLARISQSERESRTLAALRDALLPKLIRGEIRVEDAERFLERRGL